MGEDSRAGEGPLGELREERGCGGVEGGVDEVGVVGGVGGGDRGGPPMGRDETARGREGGEEGIGRIAEAGDEAEGERGEKIIPAGGEGSWEGGAVGGRAPVGRKTGAGAWSAWVVVKA